MSILIKNIKELIQVREPGIRMVAGEHMKVLPKIDNAYIFIDHDTIVDFGLMENASGLTADTEIDAMGSVVLPCWCDSHTHTVYAGNRIDEFVDRLNGLTYQEIAAKGGGILNSAKKLESTKEDQLYQEAVARIKNLMALGTGAIEIKSGYGLTTDSELKMLRVIKRIKRDLSLKVIPTFLGAHAVPEAYADNKNAYVDLIIKDMMPAIQKDRLAKYIDVFCEKGYFGLEATDSILEAAKTFGLIPKIHVNQFNAFGGVALAVKHNALSVDHLEELLPEDIEALKGSRTIPVALPGCSLFLDIPYTPGRELIDSGLPLALASDFNPGSAPSGNMNLIVSLACIKMKLTPEEAINAATLNGAYAMGIEQQYGSITRGKRANIIISKAVSSYYELPYSFGSNLIDKVMINGEFIKKPQDNS
ncbi:MAG: imidazolonepropionase [Flavobacteriaceae bacterium]|nr:imidazolonepropionase [Flavobacteriaceae bacterium]